MLAFYEALSIGPMGIVSPLVSLSVLVPVAVALVRGESPSSIQVLGIIVAILRRRPNATTDDLAELKG
jgi:drug/metabolite transporter (DMT)-like permease